MSASVVGTRKKWGGKRDKEGHREYTVQFRVRTSSTEDGPNTVMNASGLAMVGSMWLFGNDIDTWAQCYPELKIQQDVPGTGEKGNDWLVTQTFGTKPINRCQDVEVEDPLMEPMRISGSFVKYLKEISEDKDGNVIASISGEKIRGSSMEFDDHRATVRVSQNVAALGLSTFTEMMNTVNDAKLWGLDSRHIKLSNVTWERKVYGTCNYYYTRAFEFEIDFDDFDRSVPDVSRKVLYGSWNQTVPPAYVIGGLSDKTNLQHYLAFQDPKGNPGEVFLNDNGGPVTSLADARKIDVEYYGESNFLTLGIPTSL